MCIYSFRIYTPVDFALSNWSPISSTAFKSRVGVGVLSTKLKVGTLSLGWSDIFLCLTLKSSLWLVNHKIQTTKGFCKLQHLELGTVHRIISGSLVKKLINQNGLRFECWVILVPQEFPAFVRYHGDQYHLSFKVQ